MYIFFTVLKEYVSKILIKYWAHLDIITKSFRRLFTFCAVKIWSNETYSMHLVLC